jgi:putative endonuclease
MGRSIIGRKGELLAANYLLSLGYELLDANFSNPQGYQIGEIDIIAKNKQGDVIVFVEVKTRIGSFDTVVPESNITSEKLRRIIKAANYYLRREELMDVQWRIDSVGVTFDLIRRKAAVRHIKAIRF